MRTEFDGWKKVFFLIFMLSGIIDLSPDLTAQENELTSDVTIARLKYSGGGDWYNDPSAIPNLCRFIRKYTRIAISEQEGKVSLLDESLFSYPILFMTGHGKIGLSEEETARLRDYLIHGGFLFADDDYGMDKYFRGNNVQSISQSAADGAAVFSWYLSYSFQFSQRSSKDS